MAAAAILLHAAGIAFSASGSGSGPQRRQPPSAAAAALPPPLQPSPLALDDEAAFSTWLASELADAPGVDKYPEVFADAQAAVLTWRRRYRHSPRLWRSLGCERMVKELVESAPVIAAVRSVVDDTELAEGERFAIVDLCSGKGCKRSGGALLAPLVPKFLSSPPKVLSSPAFCSPSPTVSHRLPPSLFPPFTPSLPTFSASPLHVSFGDAARRKG